MQHIALILAQAEPSFANQLLSALKGRFRQIVVAHSAAEIREEIRKSRPHAVIVDLDLVSGDQLRRLCEDFRGVAFITTHRAPDVAMWMECLDLGAVDCCHRADVEGMLRAIAHNVTLTRVARAA